MNFEIFEPQSGTIGGFYNIDRAAVKGKTGKTVVLPRFSRKDVAKALVLMTKFRQKLN